MGNGRLDGMPFCVEEDEAEGVYEEEDKEDTGGGEDFGKEEREEQIDECEFRAEATQRIF